MLRMVRTVRLFVKKSMHFGAFMMGQIVMIIIHRFHLEH